MSFEAKVICDSITQQGSRITTMEWTYPRFIHSEIMTHRDRARNAASSRAIPWPVMMERILDHPVIPIHWGMEQQGMQSGDELPPQLRDYASQLWLEARRAAVDYADKIHNIGSAYAAYSGDNQFRGIKIHKSLPNRITEAWMWITVVMTATEWRNLWRLRVHEDAERHFQLIAGTAQEALEKSNPRELQHGEWHLPYVPEADSGDVSLNPSDWDGTDWRKVATARCARVSYLTHDGVRDVSKDLDLFERLVRGSGFGHWSPHEHIATPATPDVRSGPYRGWLQYRKFFSNECG